jgi:hypothetical protein
MLLSKFAKRFLIAFVTVFISLLGVLAGAAPSEAARPASPVPLAASVAPPLPAGAIRLGALSPGTKISIEVTLNIPDQAALTAFLNGLADPQSPFYQHFLLPGQFGPRFGPSLTQVAAVEDALRSAGLSPGQVSPNRLSIPVTAPASVIEHAFGLTLDSYRLPNGRAAYANTTARKVPAAVAPLVQGVLGLNDLYPVQRLSSGPRAATPAASIATGRAARPARPAVGSGPQPCAAASNSANTADVIAGHKQRRDLPVHLTSGQVRSGVLAEGCHQAAAVSREYGSPLAAMRDYLERMAAGADHVILMPSATSTVDLMTGVGQLEHLAPTVLQSR